MTAPLDPKPGAGGSVLFEEEAQLVEEEELWTDDCGEDHAGWFCVRTDPFPLPGGRVPVRGRVHDRRAPDPRLGGARRPEPPLARPARQGGGAEPASSRTSARIRAERVVLRLGGGRPAGARHPAGLAARASWSRPASRQSCGRIAIPRYRAPAPPGVGSPGGGAVPPRWGAHPVPSGDGGRQDWHAEGAQTVARARRRAPARARTRRARAARPRCWVLERSRSPNATSRIGGPGLAAAPDAAR